MWRGARPGEGDLLEPDPESLLVYLSMHVVGHRFARTSWIDYVSACSSLVTDWNRVWRIADEARLSGAVRLAIGVASGGEAPEKPVPVLDGMRGRAVWELTRILRGHPISPAVRTAFRGLRGAFRPPARVQFLDMELLLGPTVYRPEHSSVRLTTGALDRLEGQRAPLVVDAGTGSGAIALGVARARPDAQVFAIDVSPISVRWARRNAARLGLLRVRFLRGRLLAPLPDSIAGRVSAVVANLPEPVLGSVAEQSLRVLEPGGLLGTRVEDGALPRLVRMLTGLAFDVETPEGRRGAAVVVWARAPRVEESQS
jgi:SAM-dependent methyltransferase